MNTSSQYLSWYQVGLVAIAAQLLGAAVVGAAVVGAAVVGGEGVDPPHAVGAATSYSSL